MRKAIDRREVKRVLETEGVAAALARWKRGIVIPIAQALGLAVAPKPHVRWRPEWNALLGTASDDAVATQILVSRATVRMRRVALHVEPAPMERGLLVDVSDAILTSNTAAHVAAQLGCTAALVTSARHRRGLHARYERPRPELVRQAALAGMLASGATLKEAADVLGVTSERARQIGVEVCAALRAALDADAADVGSPPTAHAELDTAARDV